MGGYVGSGSGAGEGHEREARHAGRDGQGGGHAENARFIRHCIRSLAFILYSIHGFI